MNEETQAVEAEAEAKESGPRMAKRVKDVNKDAALTVLSESNPKRAGSASAERFEGYLSDPAPATVQKALDAGLTMGDIKYDIIHGHIEVEGAKIEEYEVTARGPRGPKAETDEDLVESEGGDEDLLAEGAEEEAFA